MAEDDFNGGDCERDPDIALKILIVIIWRI